MSEEKTTIEDLAIMVNKGFENTATKDDLKELETELKCDINRIDSRLDTVDGRLDSIDGRLGNVDSRLDSIDRRLAVVETDISEIRKTYVDPQQFEDLMARVKYIEVKLGVESGK